MENSVACMESSYRFFSFYVCTSNFFKGTVNNHSEQKQKLMSRKRDHLYSSIDLIHQR